MKVFALVVLLVSVCSLEGALVKRETSQVPAQLTDIFQKLQELATDTHRYLTTEVANQEKLEEIKAQAQTYYQNVRSRVDPMTAQVREGLNQAVASLLDSLRAFAQKPVENS